VADRVGARRAPAAQRSLAAEAGPVRAKILRLIIWISAALVGGDFVRVPGD